LRTALEQPHVALGNHPVAEVRGADEERLAVAVDDLLVVGVGELGGSGGKEGKKNERGEKSTAWYRSHGEILQQRVDFQGRGL
jgi:hypothetical protein